MNVIAYKNIPVSYPTAQTLIAFLFLERYNCGDMAFGIFYTIAAIVWIACIIAHVKQKETNIFNKESN